MTDPDDRARRPLQIGDWRLDPLNHSLSRAGDARRLPKRLVLLLLELARQPGTTVTREALLDRVWRRRVVADEVLSRSIAELRQALQDDARAPQYIETIPKTGYRLIAAVTAIDDPQPAGDAVAPLPPSAAEGGLGSPVGQTAPPSVQPGTRSWLPWMLAGLLLTALAVVLMRARDGSPDGLWTAASMAAEQPFLSEPDWTLQPRYSRDGRWLVHLRRSPVDGRRQILYGPADGGASQTIDAGSGLVSGPVLSPDGSALAVLARVDGRCELRVLQLPAGAPRRVADCDPRHGDSLEWTIDGALIFTAPATGDGGSGLARVEPDSGALTPLTHPSRTDIADRTPRLAADGRLAFIRGPLQMQTVWLLEDGRERVLLPEQNRVPGVAWAAGDRQLLVASNAPGYPALLAVDPGSGRSHVLGGRGAGALDVAPDGTLLFEQRRYDANLWQLSAAPPRQLTASTRYDAMPALSPDGSRIAYVSNRDGPSSIWLLQLADGSERRLDLPEAAVWTRPNWTADGGALLLTRYDEASRTTLARLSLDSGRVEDLGIADAFAGTEAADGSLLYTLHGEGGARLWRRPPGGTVAPVDGASGLGEFRSSGDWLAWQRLGQPGIVVMPLAGGEPRRLLDDLAIGEPSAWQLAGDRLVYLDASTTPAQLWRVDLASGEREPWLDAPDMAIGPMLAVDRAGGFAVLGRIDRLEVDLLRVSAPR